MSKKIAIIGAGGFSCQILDLVNACNRLNSQYEILGYIIESGYGTPGTMINGFPILGDLDWFGTYQEAEVLAISSVAAPVVRFRLVKAAKEWGARFCSMVHPTATLSRHVSIGEDVVLGAGSILTFQSRIGNHVHVNLLCSIGEYAILEDFVTLSPAVRVSGNVTIGKGAFIGTGVNINEKLHIGEWSVIGAGSTIVCDVPPNTTVVGVPGKVIKTREAGWQMRAQLSGSAPSGVAVQAESIDRTKSSMPTGQYDFAAAASNGKIYAIGGRESNVVLNKVGEYNPAKDTL